MSEYFRKYIKKEHYPIQPQSIKFKTQFLNCIHEALLRRQWKQVDSDDWDIYWAKKEWILEQMDHAHLNPNQRVSHFRNFFELTRKDQMSKNIKKFKKQLERDQKLDELATFNFIPTTYMLPSEFSIFCEEFKKVNQISEQKMLWIMKPIGKSQGQGIFLFKNIKDISSWKNQYGQTLENQKVEPYVVQKYIYNPLLIGGKKFDLRVYALCVSYQPLTIYLYRTGFARFTHERYDLEDITNIEKHLTNNAIQKHVQGYDEEIGGKWFFQTLKLYLISKYGQERVSETFYQIQNIIIKSMQSVQKVMMNDKRCFELYGYDILLDQNLKPWLLEVNASPSMTHNIPYDQEVKIGLLDDTLTIIDTEKILTGQEEQIGGFDLIYKGNPINLPKNSTYSSLLGCYNNRHQQLKKLAKSTAIRLAQNFQEKLVQEQNKKPVTKPTLQQQSSFSSQSTQASQSKQSQTQKSAYTKAATNKIVANQITPNPNLKIINKRSNNNNFYANNQNKQQMNLLSQGAQQAANSQNQGTLQANSTSNYHNSNNGAIHGIDILQQKRDLQNTNMKLQQFNEENNQKNDQFQRYKREDMKYSSLIPSNKKVDDDEDEEEEEEEE